MGTEDIHFIEKQRLEYECYMRAYWMGHKMVKQNIDYVNATRALNEKEFTRDFGWYCDKFNIDRPYLT